MLILNYKKLNIVVLFASILYSNSLFSQDLIQQEVEKPMAELNSLDESEGDSGETSLQSLTSLEAIELTNVHGLPAKRLLESSFEKQLAYLLEKQFNLLVTMQDLLLSISMQQEIADGEIEDVDGSSMASLNGGEKDRVENFLSALAAISNTYVLLEGDDRFPVPTPKSYKPMELDSLVDFRDDVLNLIVKTLDKIETTDEKNLEVINFVKNTFEEKDLEPTAGQLNASVQALIESVLKK